MARPWLAAGLLASACASRGRTPDPAPPAEPGQAVALRGDVGRTDVRLVASGEGGAFARAVPESFGEHLSLPPSVAYDVMVPGAAIVIGRTLVAVAGKRIAGVDGGQIAATDPSGGGFPGRRAAGTSS